MEFKDFKTPFISDRDIKGKANFFRKEHWGEVIPVDIENIIEKSIAINIIPMPGLTQQCSTDAFISSDWQSIFVDNDKYMDDSYYNRLKFSVAHEIGHLVLHKELYENLEIINEEDFKKFLTEVDGKQYGYIETQANKFASYFLIPRHILINERKRILHDYKDLVNNIDAKQLNSYIATPLSKIFVVSAEAMEIALNTEF